MEIYLARDGQRFGPYPLEVLESYLKAGTVTGKDWAWSPSRQTWIPLKALLAELKKQPASPVTATADSPDAPGLPVEAEAPSASAPDPAKQERRAALLRKARSPRFLGAVAAGILGICILIVLVKLPSHASIAVTDHGFLRPDEGYEFVDPNDPWNWDVQWVPGTPSLTQAHMLAGSEADTWRPAPGYAWSSTSAATQELVWVPQKREPGYPHVVAAIQPGTWIVDPGYVWADSATPIAPLVVWRRGIHLPHMESAEQENYWTFDAGYAHAADSTTESPKAAWTPGTYHYGYPHVYASPTEGTWLVDSGYQWLNPDANDFRTFSPTQTWEAWRLANDIDASTHGLNCSEGAILAAIEAARDRYGALDTTDVHPLLAQHFAAVQAALGSGATTINTCFVVDHAKDGADLLAAGLCMFSDKSWQECMADSETTRKVVGAAGQLGSMSCGKAFESFGQRLDELGTERQRLQNDFRAQYGLQVTSSVRLVTCR